jgi:hypothetical protein
MGMNLPPKNLNQNEEVICLVPWIGDIFRRNFNICQEILDSFYGLVQQPQNRDDVSPNYVGKLWHYNCPFKVSIYGAYPLMTDWEMLEYKMNHVNDKSGYHKDYTREKVFEALKDFAKGFQYGYDNFINDRINTATSLSNSEEYKVRKLLDFFSSPFEHRAGFSETYGGNRDIFSSWNMDGIKAGYYYCAWSILLENHMLFEPYFNLLLNKETKIKAMQNGTENRPKIKAPVISLFCKLLNDSQIVPRAETKTQKDYCEKICTQFNLQYSDRVRQGYGKSSNKANLLKVKSQIIPKIDSGTGEKLNSYLNSKDLKKS